MNMSGVLSQGPGACYSHVLMRGGILNQKINESSII